MEIKVAVPSEVSPQFLQGMVDRMGMSFHKYGAIKHGFPDVINALDSLQDRIDEYKKTGNIEFLMDVANFAMIEFMLPKHSDAHYRATDSNESPGRREADGRVSHQGNLY